MADSFLQDYLTYPNGLYRTGLFPRRAIVVLVVGLQRLLVAGTVHVFLYFRLLGPLAAAAGTLVLLDLRGDTHSLGVCTAVCRVSGGIVGEYSLDLDPCCPVVASG